MPDIEIMIHREPIDQQPQDLGIIIDRLDGPIEILETTINKILEAIALDKKETEEREKRKTEVIEEEPVIDLSKEVQTLKTNLTSIGNIFSEILKISEEKGITRLINPIITHGFVETFKNWIGTRVLNNPEKSLKLPPEEWAKILTTLKEKVGNIKNAANLLRQIEQDEEQGEKNIEIIIGGAARKISTTSVIPKTNNVVGQKPMAANQKPLKASNPPPTAKTPHGIAARVQTRLTRFL